MRKSEHRSSASVGRGLLIPEKKKIHAPLLYFPKWKEWGISLKPRFHNEFHACLYDKAQFMKWGEKAPPVQEAWAYNVFCNQGLDFMRKTDIGGSQSGRGLSPHLFMEYCGIGTGAGSPAISDTEFFTYLDNADKASDGEVSGNDTYSVNHSTEEYYHRHKYFWDVDEGNGTLTEVGLYTYDGGHKCLSHAMFQDAEGDPISITKDATKVLIVTVTLYMERGTTDSGAMILDDFIEGLMEAQTYDYYLLWGNYSNQDGVIYLGDTDQAVDAADCYETSYPVLGSTRANADVASVADSASGYGVTLYADWNLGEGNDTWYEVGYRTTVMRYNTGGGYWTGDNYNVARFDLPSGSIAGNTLVKTDSNKLRVTIEFYFTQ